LAVRAPEAVGITAPQPDLIEVLLTLAPGQYSQMGDDLERLREQLNLPRSASNTQVIVEAVHRQAASD
jgi:hypothetical protein